MLRYWRATKRQRTCELGEGCSGNGRRQTTIPCKADATGGEKKRKETNCNDDDSSNNKNNDN